MSAGAGRSRAANRRAGPAFLAAAVIAAGLACAVTIALRPLPLRLFWHERRARSSDPATRRAGLEALHALGWPGDRAIEGLAFDRDLAPPPPTTWYAVRQDALDFLWQRVETDPLDGDLPEPRWIRYLVEARGLERRMALEEIGRHLPALASSTALLDALDLVVLTEPDEQAADLAVTLAYARLPEVAGPILRRAAELAVSPDAREVALRLGLRLNPDPANEPVVRACLRDPVASVRAAAAFVLTRTAALEPTR